MTFSDRKEAGRLLGEYLKSVIKEVDVVLGIPRGGVVVAKEVASILNKPLSLLIVRKLGVPHNPELAFGAIDPDGQIYTDQQTVKYYKLSTQDIQKVAREELNKIRERERRFLRGKPLGVKDKVVVVVDDGIATGQTVMAGVEYLKRKWAKEVMVAAPVCHKEAVKKLISLADRVYCYHTSEESTFAVGMYYADFHQVEDKEVEELLRNEIL